MVAMSRTVGKALNSSGFWMNRAVISTSTEKVIEMASEKSSRNAGIGRIRTTMIVMMPMASARSPRLERLFSTPSGERPGRPKPLSAPPVLLFAAVTSLMRALP